VDVTSDAQGAAQVTWSKQETWRSWAQLSEGCYYYNATKAQENVSCEPMGLP
jgi:hypothetical protein